MEYFGTNLTQAGHYRWHLNGDKIEKVFADYRDLPFDPEGLTCSLQKGEVAFYQGGGFTALGIAGSCADSRPGTKSIFWVHKIISKDQLTDEIFQNEAAMKIINAFAFKVQLRQSNSK